MNAMQICESPPTWWCRETSRVIQALFWGGWACYETPAVEQTPTERFTLTGERTGICECYSHAQYWLFGNDTFPEEAGALAGLKIPLTVVEEGTAR